MTPPRVSVIVPSYNHAAWVGRAIGSVRAQSWPDWELIVVDDGSSDETATVVARFDDPRVRYLRQPNRGLPAARNAGIRASSGALLAFLDADDRFHPDKLRQQVARMEQQPEVGLSYSSRILVDGAGRPLQLGRAPLTVTLADLVSGYPFAPSDVVVRRAWVERVGGFDERFVLNSEDLNFHLRLALAGCRFAGVPEALTDRQLHAGRCFPNIAGKVAMYRRALDTAFDDPRCPPAVRALRDAAHARHLLTWGWQAAVQEEAALAQSLLREALRLDPSLRDEGALPVVEFAVAASVRDGGDHEAALRRGLAQLPDELAAARARQGWAVARGYLRRGLRDVLWGRREEGHRHLQRAAALGARLDERFLVQLSDLLATHEPFLGPAEGQRFLHEVTPALRRMGSGRALRQIQGRYWINRAFQQDRAQDARAVRHDVLRALRFQPAFLTNRGVLAILARSLVPRPARSL